MKCIRFKSIGVVSMEDRPVPPLPEGHVRIRHHYSLISAGTELLKLNGFLGPVEDSGVGYSGVGEILDGEQGTPFQKGQFVFTHSRHEEIIDLPLARANAVLIPVRKDLAREATFLQLGKVAMHGLHRVHPDLGDWIVVFGLGVVGNLAAQLARLNSGGRVLAVEPVPERRKSAEAIGLRVLDPGDSRFLERIRDATDGGADVIVETSGHPAALAQSFKIARAGARISLVAGHYGKRELDLKSDFQNKELSMIAARRIDVEVRPTAEDRWTVVECAKAFYRMIEDGSVKITPLITHCLPPEKAPEAYRRLGDRDPSMTGVLFDWTSA